MRVCLCVLCGRLLGGLTSWLSFVVSSVGLSLPVGVLGQVWYLIVSIPDLCTLTYLLCEDVGWSVVCDGGISLSWLYFGRLSSQELVLIIAAIIYGSLKGNTSNLKHKSFDEGGMACAKKLDRVMQIVYNLLLFWSVWPRKFV